MVWARLKNNKCPLCNEYLMEDENSYGCLGKSCQFTIGKIKFNQILAKLYRKPTLYVHGMDNAEELNNL